MDKTKLKPVYKMNYAMELIQLGHEVAMTTPNPRNQNLVMWFFKDDESFDDDFRRIKEADPHE